MHKPGDILYCHATRQTRTVGPGHWFFHTGQWAACGEAHRDRQGAWHVRLSFAPYGKKIPEGDSTFSSITEVQKFVGEFFGNRVVIVKPTEFPRPDEL